MLKSQGLVGEAVRVMERFIEAGAPTYDQVTEYGQRLLEYGDFDAAAGVLDRVNALKAKASRQMLRDQALKGARDDLAAGIPGAQKRAYLVALEHLVFERPAQAETAFLEIANAFPAYAPAWLGLRGARHALGQADATAITETQCRNAPGHPPEAVIDAIMARPLSRRGLVFDPDEPIRWRSQDEIFVRVDSAADLRVVDNSLLVLDPGGELIQCDPVVLFGAPDEGPPSYQSIEQSVLSVKNAVVVGLGQVLTGANEAIKEFAGRHIAGKYNATLEGDELRFNPVFFRFGMVRVRCFEHPAILLTGPAELSFGDWINNFLPRLGLIEAAGVDCPVLVSDTIPPQFIEMIVALGIRRERIIFHDQRGVSIFPKLYVPSWTSNWDYDVAGKYKNRAMAGVYEICQRAQVASPKRKGALLYLSRRNVGSRPLVNEAEVKALFVSKGFEVVEPETMSFDEVREAFAEPACVAGPYGSAFHNLVFSRHKPLCLALTSPAIHRVVDELTLWFGMAGLRAAYVEGVAAAPDAAIEGREGRRVSPWTVDLDQVEQAIDRMLSMLGRGEPA